MSVSKLELANFDARISKIEIKPKHLKSKVILNCTMYDEEKQAKVRSKVVFEDVAAIDFRINLFDCGIGAEAAGLFSISNKYFAQDITEGIFHRRKELYLLEGQYEYDEKDEHDLLNCYDLDGSFRKHLEDYKVYLQNMDAGVYLIVAKSFSVIR